MKATKLTSELLRLITIVLTVVITTSASVEAGSITITDVSRDPLLPTVFDSITIKTFIDFNLIAYPQMVFNNSDFEQSGMSLQLDLHFYEDGMGMGTPIVSPLLEPIGMLTEGFYDLTVRAYVSPNPVALVMPELSDEYFTSFQVIPEPTTLLLLVFGALGLLKRRTG